jgi:hypothetical protein
MRNAARMDLDMRLREASDRPTLTEYTCRHLGEIPWID